MPWKRMLAYATGEINESLVVKIGYPDDRINQSGEVKKVERLGGLLNFYCRDAA